MLYEWLYSFSDQLSGFNVFRYITFRTFVAFFSAFLICWLWGPKFIRRLKRNQYGQVVRDDGPQTHLKKQGTPTMGGGLMVMSIFIPSILWADWKVALVWACLIVTLSFAFIGFADDYMKVAKKNTKGLHGKLRLLLEFAISGGVIATLIYGFGFSTELAIPFFKNAIFDLGWFYIVFASLVIVGCANAVNLTDGLDGLAIVPIMIATATYLIFAYIAGRQDYAEYLQIPYIANAGELAPVAATVIAAGLGFLWYNAYPAQVFMGDVGSLGLGGFLGTLAVLTKNEILLVLVGGVFVAEALSVITQVASFKLTGKRVFRMAPLHHHFELKGLTETKIIVRFWIVSILLAILSLSTLKLR